MDASRYIKKRTTSSHIGGRHRFSACDAESFDKGRYYKTESIRDICKEKCDNAIILLADRASESKIIREGVKTAAEWIDIDNKEYRVEGEYKKIPLGAICLIVAIAILLILMVAGNIMVSRSYMELWSLENEYQLLEEYEAEMEAKLTLKNDLRYIEYVARTKLGMIERDHAEVVCVGAELHDKVETFYIENDTNNAIVALLYALKILE